MQPTNTPDPLRKKAEELLTSTLGAAAKGLKPSSRHRFRFTTSGETWEVVIRKPTDRELLEKTAADQTINFNPVPGQGGCRCCGK